MKQLVPFSKTSAAPHCMKLPSCQAFRLPSSSQQFLFSKKGEYPETTFQKGEENPLSCAALHYAVMKRGLFPPPTPLLQDLETAKEPLDACLERLFPPLSPKSCVALQQILLYHLPVRKTQKYKFIGKSVCLWDTEGLQYWWMVASNPELIGVEGTNQFIYMANILCHAEKGATIRC